MSYNSCLEDVENVVLEERGADFLQRPGLKKSIRREISFGLIPKTFKGEQFL